MVNNKIDDLCKEANSLIEKGVTCSAPGFKAWSVKAHRLLIKLFGEDSYEIKEFDRISYSLSIYTFNTPDYEFVQACKRGLEKAIAMLQALKEDISDESISEESQQCRDYRRIFVVHGHDGELRESVARVIERQGIEAIILNEQVNLGKTIIEKLEEYGDAACAVCLFTNDDLGRSKSDESDKPRARQNVVFEAGYFIGRFGRENVVVLADKGIELPSDMHGIVYTDTESWKFSFLKELRAIGYTVDMNKLD
jgi:predicted nucleotide-binding protein